MGTNELGQDIFSQVLYGARVSLMVGVVVTTLSILIGVPIGLVAGFYGGKIDTLLHAPLRYLPRLPAAAAADRHHGGARRRHLQCHDRARHLLLPLVLAHRARRRHAREERALHLGRALDGRVGSGRIMLRHALPNSTTPIIVQGSMDFGYAILACASLSFIGIGAQPPTPEWGLMAALSRTRFIDNWWTVTFPGLAIFVTVLAVNLIGDGIRDILDPKQQSSH